MSYATDPRGSWEQVQKREPDLTASLVLLPDLWLPHVAVGGDPALAVPTRIEPFICGSDDAGPVEAMREIVPEIHTQADGKPVAEDLYRLQGTTLIRMP